MSDVRKLMGEKAVTLGQLLDLIDNNRESEEMICIMNGCGKVEMRGMVCSRLWDWLEDMTVNSIGAEDGELHVWLDD